MGDITQTVLITGASSGFGSGAARAFADKGNRVWAGMRDVNGRNSHKKAELEAYSDQISVVEMDVTNDASVTKAVKQIEANECIDILINNAGVMFIGLTEAFSVTQARAQMETNYFGAIRTMQAVLPAMRERGAGLIINTSSLVGRITGPFFGTYAATKHALEAYSQSLRYELSPFGVDVAIVEPGPFGTNLIASGQSADHQDVVAAYGQLGGVPDAMLSGFAQMLAGPDAPDPKWVVDAYLALADKPKGQRPTRTVVGITWGVDEINRLTQTIQDAILQEMQLEGLLSGKNT